MPTGVYNHKSPSVFIASDPVPMSANASGSNIFQRQVEATESVWLSIGRAAETMGDLERAQKAYERVLATNPMSWRALTQAAHVCRCREDYPRAVEYFNRAIQIDDKNGDIWSSLGHCFLMQDELQSAYNAYQQALFHLHSPKEDAKLWYGIGILYDRYGSLQHAEEAFSSVLKMDQNFEKADEIYFRLGIIYKQLQRYSESLRCFDQILRNPPHPLSQMDIWFQIGHVYEQQKDYERARDAWDRVLTEAPNHAKVLQQLGWLYHQSAAPFCNQEIAVQYLTRSLETDSSDAQSWYLLGRAYMTSQKYNKAYEAYQQAVYRDGRNPTFWISIGVLYFQINQFKDALDAYSRAIRLNPYISEVWFDLGSLYETCNQQIKDAMDAYVRAKELDPTNQTVKERLDLLSKHMQDPSISLGPAPPPKDVHPTAYSNFQAQPADAPPPMRIHANARPSPPRHGAFNGAGGPLPNGAYQPGHRAHSRHGSPARYGDGSLPSHSRGGEDYRSRALPPPQDVEMSDARERSYASRPSSAHGHRAPHQQYHVPSLPPHHTQPSGSQTIPPILHHPQPQAQTSNSYRKYGSSRKRSPRSPSPSGPLPPPPPPPRGRASPSMSASASVHQTSSAAGGHYGSYGPTSTTRYSNGNLVERGRSPGIGASSASGGPYGATIVPSPSDGDTNWERERRSYASGPLPPVDARDARVDRESQYPDRSDRDRVPLSSSIRVKEEPREKNVRLPPPPPLGGSQQQQHQSQQQPFDATGRRSAHDRRMSDDYEMRPPASTSSGPGQYGPAGYDYDRSGRPRTPPPPPPPHASSLPSSSHSRRYDPLQDDRGPAPPRQTSPFHPAPLRQHPDVSPVSHYDDRDRRRGLEDPGPYPPHAQESPDRNRRRSGRGGDKDETGSMSGAERGASRRRGARIPKKERDPYPPASYGHVTPQPPSAFSAPPASRSPGWQHGGSFPAESYEGRKRSTSFGTLPQHQRFSSDANSQHDRRQPYTQPPPPLVPNKPMDGANRPIDEAYDDPSDAADTLIGLAGSRSVPPSSVTSTATSAIPPSIARSETASPPIQRPGSTIANRKRRRSGSASSTEHPPSHHSLMHSNANAEPEKKKARLEDSTPPPSLVPNAREGSVPMNGRSRPSLPRIHTREEEDAKDEDKVRDMVSPSTAVNNGSAGSSAFDTGRTNSILNGDKTSSPSPIRRQPAIESNTNSPPESASMQETASATTATTPTRKTSETKLPSMQSSSQTPTEKTGDDKRTSIPHSRSTSINNLTNGSGSS